MEFVNLETISTKIDYGLTESATERDTGYKFLRITDIRQGKINWAEVPFCECSESDAKKYELQEGDIVFARTGSVGNTGLIRNDVPKGSVFASYLIRIRPNKDVIDPEYLAYYFQTPDYWRQIDVGAVGAIQGGLNATKLAELKLPLPPLDEQKRIASLLARADRLRGLRRAARRLADSLLQSVFLEMFGEPQSNLKKWNRVEIADVTESLDSWRIPVEASIRQTKKGQYPYYGASGIIDYVEEYIFDEETLLVAEDGANLLARSTPIAFIATGKYWVNNHAHVLRMKGINIQFLCYLLNMIDLEPYVTGSAQPKLNTSNLEKIRVIFPPLPLQEEFARVAARVEGLRARQAEAERQAEGLFQSLLAQSFDGGR